VRIIEAQTGKFYNLDHIISYEIDDSQADENIYEIYITDCTGKIHEYCSINFKEFKDGKIYSYELKMLFMSSIIQFICELENKILSFRYAIDRAWDFLQKQKV